MPAPTDGGKTYTFKIREGVKFHDGSPLTAEDVAASWKKIIFPPPGVASARQGNFVMVDSVEAPDPTTVVFRLKFATDAFLPALADPYAFIYRKEELDKDPHWYEKNILGSGPFKFVSYEAGQSIAGERNPDYYHKGLPYLDGFQGIFAAKQVVRVEAIRSDRAAIEFRGFPPAVRDELVGALGDKIAVQTSDWNCGGIITINHKKKPFDDPRVRRALTLAIDRWGTAPELSKIAIVKTVGGVVFPGSPLAADQGGTAAARRLLARYREIARRGAPAVEGGGGRGAQLRTAQPRRRSALQILRPLGHRPVEQDRPQRHAARAADRPVVSGIARRQFHGIDRGELPERRQPARRCQQIPARFGRRNPITAISRTRRRSSCTSGCCANSTSRSSAS